MERKSKKDQGEKLPSNWTKKKHAKPIQKKIDAHRKFLESELFEKKTGIPATRAKLAKKGLEVSDGTLRTYVKREFSHLGPVPSKRPRGEAQIQLDRFKDKIELAVYESDLTYSDIHRGLQKDGVKVGLDSLIIYITKNFYSSRGRPERFS